ncbi:type II toxin-antitoxin system HigB family toxin [Mucilaginibacter sp. L3T2-6]|uniref:type II toxin-antitoxin system HigB family toxin n=1 Tax=Mucilaginibacter sp. L3T2-6 TaxID=3062491 RepID=UPI002676401F|nr:type II toxin-antitoxin system HigB family toxin [Mucilaginibacter sp. L3T2-6]MDO3641771.1 type II toxin-antitoxin system HigB family toxin [Mucilaginibacter sp. L3T2-6]MDV6214265.1 type II toxin-antitoxin system HigB family toxin [Mucilaginibacter sp. L3T2-6]
MEFIGKTRLLKLKKKNKGNTDLCNAIDQLITDIESNSWTNEKELKAIRPDADQVHNDGFYFFDIHIHRTLILIEFGQDGIADVVWADNHAEYERTFKNNKAVIAKWLKDRGHI